MVWCGYGKNWCMWLVYCRLDHQLKNLEIGQARWSRDNPLYLAYIQELHDKRQKDLLLSMHSVFRKVVSIATDEKICRYWHMLHIQQLNYENIIVKRAGLVQCFEHSPSTIVARNSFTVLIPYVSWFYWFLSGPAFRWSLRILHQHFDLTWAEEGSWFVFKFM